MRYIFYSIIYCFISILPLQPCFSQGSGNAPELLGKLKKAVYSENGWRAGFIFDDQKGTMWMLKDRVKISFNETLLFFDGKTVSQYLPDANELTLTNAEDFFEPDELSFLDPSELFNLNAADFEITFLDETIIDGKNISGLNLVPKNKKLHYKSLQISIDKASGLPVKVNTTQKDGTVQELYLIPIQERVTETDVKFNDKSFPGIEIIDLR